MFSLIKRLGIRDSLRAGRDVIRGGGPAGIRIVDSHSPEGLIVLTVQVDLEIPLRDGGKTTLSPGIPLAPMFAWPWRVGKASAAIHGRITE